MPKPQKKHQPENKEGAGGGGRKGGRGGGDRNKRKLTKHKPNAANWLSSQMPVKSASILFPPEGNLQ